LAQKLSDLAHVLVRPPPKPWTKITILGVKGSRDLIVEYNKLGDLLSNNRRCNSMYYKFTWIERNNRCPQFAPVVHAHLDQAYQSQ
jgi:hypothetical protein